MSSNLHKGYRLFSGEQLNAAINTAQGATGPTGPTGPTGATGPTGPSAQSVSTGVSAAGSSRTDATQLTSKWNVLSTVASSTGVILVASATVGVGNSVVIFNDGANAVKVYGAGSDTIDGVAGSTGVTLTNALRCEFYCTAANTFKSAKLGATST